MFFLFKQVNDDDDEEEEEEEEKDTKGEDKKDDKTANEEKIEHDWEQGDVVLARLSMGGDDEDTEHSVRSAFGPYGFHVRNSLLDWANFWIKQQQCIQTPPLTPNKLCELLIKKKAKRQISGRRDEAIEEHMDETQLLAEQYFGDEVTPLMPDGPGPSAGTYWQRDKNSNTTRFYKPEGSPPPRFNLGITVTEREDLEDHPALQNYATEAYDLFRWETSDICAFINGPEQMWQIGNSIPIKYQEEVEPEQMKVEEEGEEGTAKKGKAKPKAKPKAKGKAKAKGTTAKAKTTSKTKTGEAEASELELEEGGSPEEKTEVDQVPAVLVLKPRAAYIQVPWPYGLAEHKLLLMPGEEPEELDMDEDAIEDDPQKEFLAVGQEQSRGTKRKSESGDEEPVVDRKGGRDGNTGGSRGRGSGGSGARGRRRKSGTGVHVRPEESPEESMDDGGKKTEEQAEVGAPGPAVITGVGEEITEPFAPVGGEITEAEAAAGRREGAEAEAGGAASAAAAKTNEAAEEAEGTSEPVKKKSRKSTTTTKKKKSDVVFATMPLFLKTYFLEPTQEDWTNTPAGPITLMREPLEDAFIVGGPKKVAKSGSGSGSGSKNSKNPKKKGTKTGTAASDTAGEEDKEDKDKKEKKKEPNYNEIAEHLLT